MPTTHHSQQYIDKCVLRSQVLLIELDELYEQLTEHIAKLAVVKMTAAFQEEPDGLYDFHYGHRVAFKAAALYLRTVSDLVADIDADIDELD